ncbi:MAG: phage tail tape measure protein [Pseudomonadota bacterium]
MAEEVISLKIRVGSEGVQSIDVVDGKLGKLDQTAQQAGEKLKGAASELQSLLVTAGAVATIGGATAAYIAYTDALANTASVASATREQVKLLGLAAREQAAVSVFSAKQAADAQYFLASAGMQVNQIIAAQSGVMDLAAATQSNLAQTSAAVAATLSQFGLEAAQSGRVADVFAAAISGSQATMDRLALSMRYVGPVAHSLGMDLEQTTALLMALYNSGFEASQAGTALRSAMSTLLDPTREQADVLARLGVNLTDASGKMRPFAEIVEDLKRKGAGAAEVMKIFGQEAGPGMLALIGTGKAGLDELQAKLYQSGRAAEMAKAQVDNLGGDLKMLQSASEEAAISFIEELDPALRKTVQGATWLVTHSEILTRALGTAGAAVAIFKAESMLASTEIGKLTSGVSKLWALAAANPFTAAVIVLGTMATAVAAYAAATEDATEKQARLHHEAQDASREYAKLKSEIERQTKAVGDYEAALVLANGERSREKDAVKALQAAFPGLRLEYDGTRESLESLVRVAREHLAIQQQIRDEAARQERDKYAADIEQTRAMVDGLKAEADRLSSILAQDTGETDPEADIRFVAARNQMTALAETAAGLVKTYQEFGLLKGKVPELAGEFEGAQKAIVGLLDGLSKNADALTGSPAKALAQIADLIRAVATAAEEAGTASARGARQVSEEWVKAAAKIDQELAKLTLGKHAYDRAQVLSEESKLLRLALANNASGEELTKIRQRTQLSLAEVDKKEAEEAKKAADKRLADVKKVDDEIIKSHKAVQDQRAKDEKTALDASEKWDQDQLKLKQWYAEQKAKVADGEAGYKIAKLEEEWEAFYSKNERTIETERIRAATIEAIRAESAKKNRSALDKAIAEFADADKQMGELTAHTLKNIQSTLAGDLAGGFKKLFGDVEEEYGYLGARLIDITSQVVSQILVIWGSANIARMFSGGDYLPLFGGVVGGQQQQAGGGILNAAGMAKSAWDLSGMFGGSSGGAGAWLTKTFGASGDVLGVGMGGAGESTLWGMSAGQLNAMLGAAGIGALGGQLVTPLIYGDKGYSTLGGTVGAAAGAAAGMSTTAMAALGLAGGPWTAAAMAAAGLLLGGGAGSLFGDEEPNDAPQWYAANLQKLTSGQADALTLNDLVNQMQKGGGGRDQVEAAFKAAMASGQSAWWQQSLDTTISGGHLGDQDYWRVAGLGGGLEGLGGDQIKDLAAAVAAAEDALGPFQFALRGVLEGLDLSAMSADELTATLQDRVTPALAIQAQKSLEVANGADLLTATSQALQNSISALVYTEDLSATSKAQLIDVLLNESASYEDLMGKQTRLNEILKALSTAHDLGADKTGEMVDEARELAKALGLQKKASDDLVPAVDKLVEKLTALVDKMNGVDVGGGEADSYHEGGPVRPRYHDGNLVLGPGEVEAILMQNEFVVRERAVAYYGEPALNALNNQMIPREALAALVPPTRLPRFHDGGPISELIRPFMPVAPDPGPWGGRAGGGLPVPVQNTVTQNINVNISLSGDVIGEKEILDRVRREAFEGVRDGLAQASEAGEPVIHERGIYKRY